MGFNSGFKGLRCRYLTARGQNVNISLLKQFGGTKTLTGRLSFLRTVRMGSRLPASGNELEEIFKQNRNRSVYH